MIRSSAVWKLVAGVLLASVFSLVPLRSSLLAQALPSIADKTRGLTKLDGFIPLYWDGAAGKLWMEIPRLGEELLYITAAPTGLGSNDIGLDRGQISGERIVRFERVGNKVLMVQPNYGFRAGDTAAAARRAVEESFATSTLWGFSVEAETGGTLLVDATDFVMRDVHNVVGTLARTRQGTFRLDQSRSALYPANTKVFLRNTEIETSLTFTGESPGEWIRDVAPSADAVTIRQRISLVALPEPGYSPRELDVRGGFFGVSYRDLTAPLGTDQTTQFIARHRLTKRNPGAAVSEPVKPIIYYLDRGTPEPIRSAVLDGARWWNQAFEAAGYRNAFQVELLPEGADPMDVRYNVIQWVHRYTRGWSYGNTVTDPRTGEIIKGHVTLGSLRVRQDYLLAEGLLGPYRTGDERATAAEAMALARLRQLSAHEVGHTLGLQHNYIASTAGRASVMDYPHPVAKLATDGSIDLSDAYATGIGAWDKEAIKYGYSDLAAGTDVRRAIDAMLTAARGKGLRFLSDRDARPLGSAHPTTHLWDNGTDAVTELQRMLQVRRAALERFGEQTIQRGRPLAALEEVLVPLYLHHRYQVEAAAKIIGGQYYSYALRGDNQEPVRPVSPAEQRRALSAVLQTISPRELAIPRSVIAKIPPRPSGMPDSREVFEKVTSPVFDAITPAAAAADMVAQLLFNSERAARLVQQHSMDTAQPGLVEVIDSVMAATSKSPGDDPYYTALGRAAQRVVVDRLIWLAATTRSPEVRSIATFRLRTLADELAALPGLRPRERQGKAEGAAHLTQLLADISRYLERPWDPQSLPRPFVSPMGAPIGGGPVALMKTATETLAKVEVLAGLEPIVHDLMQAHEAKRSLWFPSRLLAAPPDSDPDRHVKELRRRAEGISLPARIALALNLLTEEGLPHFHRVLAAYLGGDSFWSRWTNLWTAEEDRHGAVMHDYARDSRVLDIPVLERMQFEYLRSGFDPVWDKDPYRLFVYTTLQERATQESHSNTGKLAGSEEPVIGNVLMNVAKEEARHYSFYRTIFKEVLARDPNRALASAAEVMPSIDMPGASMPQFRAMADVLRRAGIYGPRDYLAIVEEQIGYWAIGALDGLDELGKRAQEKILQIPARLTRVAEVLETRSRAKSFVFDVAFAREFSMP